MEINQLQQLAADYISAKGRYHYWKRMIISWKKNGETASDSDEKTYNYILSCYTHSSRNAEWEMNQRSAKLKTALGSLDKFCGKYSSVTREYLFNETWAKNLDLLFHCEFPGNTKPESIEFLLLEDSDGNLYMYKIYTDILGLETTSILF